MRKLIASALILAFVCQWSPVTNYADTRPSLEDKGASGLALALRRLQTIASMLHTAAHPDDESTELLAYLARAPPISRSIAAKAGRTASAPNCRKDSA